jgi:hypothetical protein
MELPAHKLSDSNGRLSAKLQTFIAARYEYGRKLRHEGNFPAGTASLLKQHAMPRHR